METKNKVSGFLKTKLAMIIILSLIPTVQLSLARAQSRQEVLAQRHYQKGKKYYRQGMLLKAKEEFQQVLRLSPQDTWAKLYLRRIQEELGGRAEISRLKDVRLKADRLKEHYIQGKDFYIRGDYRKAKHEFAKVLQEYPAHKYAQKYLRQCQLKLKELKEKKEELKAQKRAMREEAELKRVAKKRIQRQNRLEERARLIAKRKEEQRLRRIARQKIREKREEQRRAERERKQKLTLHLVKGKKFYRNGQYQEAIDEFQEVLRIDPKHKGAAKYMNYSRRKIELQAKREMLAQRRAKARALEEALSTAKLIVQRQKEQKEELKRAQILAQELAQRLREQRQRQGNRIP